MVNMFISQLITVGIIHLFAVMSPGPDFAMVSRNSLIYSRKIAIYTALGIALGISIHVAYCILGLGLVISQSILLFNLIKYVGAGYLIYIGYKSIRSKPVDTTEAAVERATVDISKSHAVWGGFLTNVLNPKATLFFLALFTQVMDPNTPKSIQLLYGIEMMIITFVWFAFIALLFSN